MAGLISPKPVSYLQQHVQYNHYARSLPAYSGTSPIPAASVSHLVPHQTPNQYLPNAPPTSALAVHEESRIHSLVIDLLDPNTREAALLELSKKREQYEDLALVLWHSFGVFPSQTF
jgi:CCR4-NOT transcription complex subunit 9